MVKEYVQRGGADESRLYEKEGASIEDSHAFHRTLTHLENHPYKSKRWQRKARLTTTTHSPNNSSSSPERIIIADDHELVREVMRSMLHSEPDLQIIDEAKDGQEAIELTRLQRPDLVLMDVRMPKVSGLKATQTIKDELPTTKVLIVSAYDDPFWVSEAVRAGADGYVLKLPPTKELLDVIRGVLGGESQYPRVSEKTSSRHLGE